MKSCRSPFVALMRFVLLSFALLSQNPAAAQTGAPDSVLNVTLDQLGRGEATVIDLTHALNDKSPFWPGENYQPFQLRDIATLARNGVSSKAFAMPEHFGTHLDAPCHFEEGQVTVDQIAAADLVAPGAVVDVTMKAEQDPDTRATVEDLQAWEQQHGPLPRRSIVLLRTGWGRWWTEPARYRNQDTLGQMHFPGFSADAVRWLIRERDIRAIGIDTLSIDHGPSRDFIVHHVLNGAGRYGLENVANLEKLPARNFFLLVAPIKIQGGTGGPTRIHAILPVQK